MSQIRRLETKLEFDQYEERLKMAYTTWRGTIVGSGGGFVIIGAGLNGLPKTVAAKLKRKARSPSVEAISKMSQKHYRSAVKRKSKSKYLGSLEGR